MHNQHENRIPLLVICGPTAAGKTKLSIDLALQLNGEIVSADSMQVYRQMNIGTAKPTSEEMQNIPHHMLDFVEPSEQYSLVEYLQGARRAVQDIVSRGRLPILVGGTGLYIHSLIDNIQFEEIPSDPMLRQKFEQEAKENGNEVLWQRLQTVDPVLAHKLHPNNLGRVIRALEVYTLSGVPMSEQQRHSRRIPSPYTSCMLGLSFRDRDALYKRIDERVDGMLQQGLLEEVRALGEKTLSRTARQAIGYKELLLYLEGSCSLEQAVAKIKLGTKRYAKRQLTWLRRDTRINWFYHEDHNGYEAIFSSAIQLVHHHFPHLIGEER